MGHWEYYNGDGYFKTLEEMWEYIRDNGMYYDEVDIERYLNNRYTGTQMLLEIRDAGTYEALIDKLMDEYESDIWIPEVQEALVEGENYDYNGIGFNWVEDEEDENDD